VDRETAERFSPFGAADCETEVQVLGEDYRKYFFYHTRFNDSALDPNVFLIIGRRGSGKTALSQYFAFQKQMRHSSAIDVDEPAAFQQVMQRITEAAAHTREVAIPSIARVWEFVIWSIIFRTYQHRDVRIRAACIFGDRSGKLSNFIRHVLNALLNRFLETEEDLLDELEDIFADERIQSGKAAVLELARKEPIIVAVDTLENYAIHDDTMMRVTSALLQCGCEFNREYARKGIHLKIFMMAEVFPYIKEEGVLNTLKFIRNEVYLHWRPKDLMRLISWRFYHYLKAFGMLKADAATIDWDDHNDVQKKMWEPYFGESLKNRRGMVERTYPYVLRHTHMRPRQLIVLCNSIAEKAKREKTFPIFQPEQIVSAVMEVENALADEVFNSYSSVYPKVGRIVEALSGLPMVFKGNELDKRAPMTASEWLPDQYSPLAFRQLVAELGIVGRVRHLDERAGVVEADFEYSSESRLPLLVTDQCVIHPMFYRKLNTRIDRNLRVYPFPDHEEYRELEYAAV
jgi:hypothetical protein